MGRVLRRCAHVVGKGAVFHFFLLAYVACVLPSGANAQEHTIMAFGTSFTAGRFVPNDEIWVRKLEIIPRADGFDAKVINQGVNGNTSHQLLARFDVIPGNASAVILEYSVGNDERAGLSRSMTIKNVHELCRMLAARSLPFILLVRGRDSRAVAEQSAWFRDLTEAHQVTLVPIEQPASSLVDGQHPNAAEHGRIAALLRSPVEAMLAKP